MATLNLGTLTVDSSGRVSLSGLSSGIDFQDTINKIIDAKRIPIVTLENRISVNDERVLAYKELRDALNALMNSVSRLYGAATIDGSSDIFKAKKAFTSTARTDGKTPTAAGNLIGITLANKAAAGTHTLEIRRTATALKISSKAFSDLSTALGISGSFTINNGTEDVTVTVASTDTLADIRDRINNANTGTNASGVSSSIVSVSSTEHYLVLTKDDTGEQLVLTESAGSATTPDAGTALANIVANVSPVAQVDTVTLAGTIEEGDVYRVTVDGNTVNYTVQRTDTTLTQVRDGLLAAINADPTVSAIVTAAAGGAAGELTLTADSPGIAFTSSASTTDTTAFTADAGASATTIQAAGGGLPQIDEVTLSGAVDVGDVYTVVIDGNTVDYIVQPSDTTLDNVRDGLVAAVNADPTVSGIVTAAAGGAAKLTLTADVVDTPFTDSASATDYAPVNDQSASSVNTVANVSAVAQVDEVTLSGAVDPGDVFRVVVDGTTVSYTVQSSDTTLDDIRDGLVAAINADPTVGAIVTAAAGGTGKLTLTADNAGTAFTATSSATDTGTLLSDLGLSSTAGTGGFRNGLSTGSKVEGADGFAHILFDGTQADNSFLVTYDSSTKVLTLTKGDGTTDTATLSSTAIATGKTETATFSTFGVTIVLDENFDKGSDITIDADVFSKTGGTAAIGDPSTIKITDSVGNVSALNSTTLTFGNLGTPTAISITAAGGFSATGVDLSTTGAKTVTLSDGNGNSLTVSFTLTGAFNGSETAASIDLQELENLVASTGTRFDNVLQNAQTARFTADGLVDDDRYESSVLTSKTSALANVISVTNTTGSFTIDSTVVNYDASADSLADLATRITNDVANVTATVVADGSGFRMDITTTSSSLSITDTSGLMADLGVNNSLVIERSSNTVSDLFSGVTLSLFQQEPETTIKIEIERDLSAIKAEIQGFVDAYNEARRLINGHSLTDSDTGGKSEDAGVLFGSRTLGDIRSRLAAIIGDNVDGVDSAFAGLAQIGVKLVDNNAVSDELDKNTLTIDESTLDDVLIKNPEDVRRLTGFDFSSSSPDVVLIDFGKNTAYAASGYTLNVGTFGQFDHNSKTVSDKTATLDDATNSVGATTSGQFDINGTAITYTVTTDTLDSLVNSINAAGINGVNASIATDSNGSFIKIHSAFDPLVIDNDTGNLLSKINFQPDDNIIDTANIDGAADGSNDGTVITGGRTLTVTNKSGAEELKVLYNGAASTSGIQIDFTVGLGAAMFFKVASITDLTDGAIEGEIEALEGQTTLANKRIDLMEDRIGILRESLTRRFVAMEVSLATLNRTLDLLKQQFDLLTARN